MIDELDGVDFENVSDVWLFMSADSDKDVADIVGL